MRRAGQRIKDNRHAQDADCPYCVTEYDLRRVKSRLNALQFHDGDRRAQHPLHPCEVDSALPLGDVVTHGWPGSVVELLEDPSDGSTVHLAWGRARGHLPPAFRPSPATASRPSRPRLRVVRRPRRAGVAGADAPPPLYPQPLSPKAATWATRRLKGWSKSIHTNLLPVPALGGADAEPTPSAQRSNKSPSSGRATSATSSAGHAAAEAIGYALLRFARGAGGLDAARRHRQLSEVDTQSCSSINSRRATSPATTLSTTSCCTG